MLDRKIAPELKPFESFRITKASTRLLDNKIPFHTIISGTQPIIRLEMVFRAGSWYEPGNGVSYFTSKMLGEGTTSHTSREIEERIAFFGAFVDFSPGVDNVTITIYSLSKYLENILPILFDIITNPLFSNNELETLKNITLQNLKVNLDKTSYVASGTFKESLFGKEHPYGKNLTEQVITNINAEVLRKHFLRSFHSGNCDIILAGSGSVDFYTIVNEVFGSGVWGSGISVEPGSHVIDHSPKSIVIKKEESVQSSIRIGLPLFTISHPDYFSTYILIEILGGYFGSRLMKNIREDKGFTYGINASFVSFKKEGYLVIGTDVDKENTAETIKEIYKEIEILKTELVKVDELDAVKNFLLGSFINSLNSPFALADKFKTIYFHGLTYAFYDQYVDSINSITAEKLMEIANKYLLPEKMVEVVVGDR